MSTNTNFLTPSNALFECLCTCIWRQSNSNGWIKRADNIAIVRIVEYNGNISLIANQSYGHKYVCLNGSLNHMLPKALVNETNKCAVHLYLHDHASWHKCSWTRAFMRYMVHHCFSEQSLRLLAQ